MCPVQRDDAFYQNLLSKRFRFLLNFSQFFGFLPYPLFHLQSGNGQERKRFLQLFHTSIGLVMFGTAFVCCVTLYLFYPEIMYEEDVPPLLNTAYHLENVLKVITVLVALLWPRTSESFYRESYNGFVQVLKLYGVPGQLDSLLVSVATNSKRLLFLYSFDALVNTVSLSLVLGHPVSTLLSLSYILPFLAIITNVLQYSAMFALIGGIVSSLNDRLHEIALEDRNFQRSFEKHKKTKYCDHVKCMERVDLAKIEKLSTLHVALMNLTARINAHCGPVLLIIMLSSFVQANIALVELYLNSDPLNKDPELSDFIIWILFLHTVTNFSYFVIIARANHTIQKEVNERAILMLLEFNCFWNSEQNAMIEYCIGQISNLPETHTACGMMNLDMKLVPSVVAAIASILFILMQFSDSRLLEHCAEQSPMGSFHAVNNTFQSTVL
uniref:Gustatory receptor n=1 Tax=Anopheles minimus TaxID=112268 RepID=A0A182WQZ2_9DIPT